MTAGDDSLREYLVTSVANQTNSPRPSDLLSTFTYVSKVPETAMSLKCLKQLSQQTLVVV